MTDWKFIQEQPLEALTDPETIQKLCDQFQIKPTRGAGQNFLIDSSILDEILEAAEIKKDDCVLEIGPGFGVLTIALAQTAKQVIAVEKDPHIVGALEKILMSCACENVKLVQEDILKISNFHPPAGGPISNKIPNSQFGLRQAQAIFPERNEVESKGCYKLVANLPYSITSAVLRKFTEEEPKPSVIVVMVQKEVAERVCAKPGEMSLLSVAIQFYGRPEIVKFVPRSVFWPEPEVESAILKISNFHPPAGGPISNVNPRNFFQTVKIGFSSRRKQLQNNLAAGLHISNEKAREILEKTSFDPKIRAQELSVEDWKKLVKFLISNQQLTPNWPSTSSGNIP